MTAPDVVWVRVSWFAKALAATALGAGVGEAGSWLWARPEQPRPDLGQIIRIPFRHISVYIARGDLWNLTTAFCVALAASTFTWLIRDRADVLRERAILQNVQPYLFGFFLANIVACAVADARPVLLADLGLSALIGFLAGRRVTQA